MASKRLCTVVDSVPRRPSIKHPSSLASKLEATDLSLALGMLWACQHSRAALCHSDNWPKALLSDLDECTSRAKKLSRYTCQASFVL